MAALVALVLGRAGACPALPEAARAGADGRPPPAASLAAPLVAAGLLPRAWPPPPPSAARALRAERLGNYSITFVSYADGEPFESTRARLARSARDVGGADRVVSHTRASVLRSAWGARVLPPLFARYPGSARYVWKPYVILRALRAARDGDFVVYADSSRHFPNLTFERSLTPLCNWLGANAAGALAPDAPTLGVLPGVRVKQRNAASLRYCDVCAIARAGGACAGPGGGACCESLWRAPHYQATWSVWQRSALSLAFVRAWLCLCEDADVIARSPYGDQVPLSIVASAYSRAYGLALPWLYFPNERRVSPGHRAKDHNALLAALTPARAAPPPFLRDVDEYPECARAAARDPALAGDWRLQRYCCTPKPLPASKRRPCAAPAAPVEARGGGRQ